MAPPPPRSLSVIPYELKLLSIGYFQPVAQPGKDTNAGLFLGDT